MRKGEVRMTALQVRECPEDVYEGIRRQASRDKRSIAQETVVMLRESLSRRNVARGNMAADEAGCDGMDGAHADRSAMRGGGVFQSTGARWGTYESKAARDARLSRRREVLGVMGSLPPLKVPDDFPSPEQLVREARDAR